MAGALMPDLREDVRVQTLLVIDRARSFGWRFHFFCWKDRNLRTVAVMLRSPAGETYYWTFNEADLATELQSRTVGQAWLQSGTHAHRA